MSVCVVVPHIIISIIATNSDCRGKDTHNQTQQY
jgi:hypothetical protein